MIMHAYLNIVFHGQIIKKPDILEGAGNTGFIDLDSTHAVSIFAVQKHCATGRLVNLSQKVKDSCFAGAVRSDQTGYFGAPDSQIKIVNCF